MHGHMMEFSRGKILRFRTFDHLCCLMCCFCVFHFFGNRCFRGQINPYHPISNKIKQRMLMDSAAVPLQKSDLCSKNQNTFRDGF